MEEFYRDTLAESERKVNQMFALQNESAAMRENTARCMLSMARVQSPEITEKMETVVKDVVQNQSQLNALKTSVSLGPMMKVDCKDSDENSKNPTEGHLDMPTDQCAI